MKSIRVLRAAGSQWRSRNGPGFDLSILRHSEIWGAADKAVLYKNNKNQFNFSGQNPVDGSIWAKESVGRANLNIHTEPTAFLSLLGVEESDSGVYR